MGFQKEKEVTLPARGVGVPVTHPVVEMTPPGPAPWLTAPASSVPL